VAMDRHPELAGGEPTVEMMRVHLRSRGVGAPDQGTGAQPVAVDHPRT